RAATRRRAARRRPACCERQRPALHRCPPGPPRDLSLRDDDLLPTQGALGDETGAAAHDVGSQPHHEPKDLDHAASLYRGQRADAICSQDGGTARVLTAVQAAPAPDLPVSPLDLATDERAPSRACGLAPA